jgi:excisionase family DNA binding protein
MGMRQTDSWRRQGQRATKGEPLRTEKIGEWMTYRQAEEFSGLSRTTLWRLVSAGEVEAAKVGQAVRINRESLDAYMRRCSASSFAEV